MSSHATRIPPRLAPGAGIRVLALSRSLGGVMRPGGFGEADVAFATARLESLGLEVSFGRWVRECDDHLTASREHRLEDLHAAFEDDSVQGILAVTGGIGAIQLLGDIGYERIAARPKILCGYSDVGHLCSAILARAGVMTCYGPNFTSLMARHGTGYTLESFRRCLFDDAPYELRPSETWSDDAWHENQERRTFHPNEGPWCIREGEAAGTIVGGGLGCMNLLQGTPYFPPLRDTLLFLEQPPEGRATLMSLDSGLRALAMQPGFEGVRGVVLGRFARSAGITRENLAALVRGIPPLARLPVAAHADFGHTSPAATLPIGGRGALRVSPDGTTIRIERH